jgi:hypothetical protein
MVLDGLEDNDDFWNVAPSDDEEAPAVDSNQSHLGMGSHGCRDSRPHCPRIDHRMKSRQEAAQSPRGFHIDKRADKEYSLTRPEMLPNGRYMYEGVYALCCLSQHTSRCNHSCKDKSTCRHLWYASFLPLHSTNLSSSIYFEAVEMVL